MSGEACKDCDRVDCPTLAPMPEKAAIVYARSHVGPGEHWLHPGDKRVASEDDRLTLNAEFDRRREAGWSCYRHRVDWRAEALRLRPVVAAAEAWRDGKHLALPAVREAIDTYRLARGKAGT